MPEMTVKLIEETLRKEVQKIDKSVQVVAVEPSKKENFYRVTLLKDRKSGSAELKKDVIKKHSSFFCSGECVEEYEFMLEEAKNSVNLDDCC